MPLFTYDPKQVTVIVGGVPMEGYAEGTFISVSPESNSFEDVSGADGVNSRSNTNDSRALFTLTLVQTSPSNDILSGFHVSDIKTGVGVVPVLIKDNSGRTLIMSPAAYIMKWPDSEFAKEITDRAWEIRLTQTEYFIGGNPDAT